MSKKIDRRGFLKALPFLPKATLEEIKESRIEKEEHNISIIRPPYSDEESDFSKCAQCDGACILSCDEKILFRLKDGSPYVSFGGKGCTFCRKCAENCELGVLSLNKPEKIKAEFYIDTERCFAWKGTMCFSCKEPCLDNAIVFKGLFNPEVKIDLCSGCGFCISSCPSNAIQVIPYKEAENV